MMKKAMLLSAVTALSVAASAAGQLPKGEFPAGFTVRTDDPEAPVGEIVFVTMRPGWHITTGPAAILYDPSLQASGEYRVDAEIFLFDPGERVEAYGLLIGGRDLEGADQAYTYFVIRHTGEFLIRRRRGDRVDTLSEWKQHESIVTWAAKGEGATAKNELAIVADAGVVRFIANGAEVASLPRARVDADGVVGLRVNHGLNLHVSSLVVTKR